MIVSLQGVSHRYHANEPNLVLDDISLTLLPGDTLGVIGPNGAGKSTLLEVIAGRIKPSLGIVERIPDIQTGYLRQHKIDRRPIPVTVLELLTVKKSENEVKQASWFSNLEINKLINERFGDLSGGQQQRVMLARAMLYGPSLLLLDEPFSLMDVGWRQRSIEFVGQWVKDNQAAMVLVSHELDQVFSLCRKVACVNHCMHFHDRADLLDQQVLQRVFNCELGQAVLSVAHKHHPGGCHGH